MKHTLIMILCCLIPLGILVVLWATGGSSNYLILAVALLCPLLHLVMMRGMSKGSSDDDRHTHH